MKFCWDNDKNLKLLSERGIDFPSIVRAIAEGKVLDVIPNEKEQYSGQWLIILCLNSYVWEVPYRIEKDCIKLITAYPSRKRRKEYMLKFNKDPCQD